MSDKLRDKEIFEGLKAKHLGLGTADTDRTEFISNIKKDTYSNLITHDPSLEMISLNLNQPKRITRHHMLEKIVDTK